MVGVQENTAAGKNLFMWKGFPGNHRKSAQHKPGVTFSLIYSKEDTEPQDSCTRCSGFCEGIITGACSLH